MLDTVIVTFVGKIGKVEIIGSYVAKILLILSKKNRHNLNLM